MKHKALIPTSVVAPYFLSTTAVLTEEVFWYSSTTVSIFGEN